MLIDKNKAKNDPYVNFDSFCLSPDYSKMLIVGRGSISIPYLYYTPLNKIIVTLIGNAEEAAWSHNSRYIAYNSKPADAGGTTIIGLYDSELSQKLSLNKQPAVPNITNAALEYTNIRWQTEDSGLKVHYLARSGEPYGNNLGEGDLIIPISSFTLQQ